MSHRGIAMKCPFCDYENQVGAAECVFCGAMLPSEDEVTTAGRESILDHAAEKLVRCSYCWKLNSPENELCDECGMPLAFVPHPEQAGKTRPLRKRGEVWTPIPEGKRRCRACWHDNELDAVLCEKCGCKLLILTEDPDYHMIKSQPSRPVVSDFESIKSREETADMIGAAVGSMVKDIFLEAREKDLAKQAEKEKIERSRKSGSVNYAEPGKIRCRNCWYDNPADATACAQCGCKLRRPRRMPTAGENGGNGSDAGRSE